MFSIHLVKKNNICNYKLSYDYILGIDRISKLNNGERGFQSFSKFHPVFLKILNYQLYLMKSHGLLYVPSLWGPYDLNLNLQYDFGWKTH